MRVLQEYERVARDPHFCDICCTYIQPGEFYRGIVQVNEKLPRKHRLIVYKMHINPSCDYPPDPVDSDDLDLEVPFEEAA